MSTVKKPFKGLIFWIAPSVDTEADAVLRKKLRSNGGSVLDSIDNNISNFEGVCILLSTDLGTIKIERLESKQPLDVFRKASLVAHFATNKVHIRDGNVVLVSRAWVQRALQVAEELEAAGKGGILEKITGDIWLGYRIIGEIRKEAASYSDDDDDYIESIDPPNNKRLAPTLKIESSNANHPLTPLSLSPDPEQSDTSNARVYQNVPLRDALSKRYGVNGNAPLPRLHVVDDPQGHCYREMMDNGATSLIDSTDQADILIFSRCKITNPTEVKVYKTARPNQIKVHYGWVHASIGAGGLKGCEGYEVACAALMEEEISEEVVFQRKVGLRQKRGEIREKRKAEGSIRKGAMTKMKGNNHKISKRTASEGAGTSVAIPDSKPKTSSVTGPNGTTVTINNVRRKSVKKLLAVLPSFKASGKSRISFLSDHSDTGSVTLGRVYAVYSDFFDDNFPELKVPWTYPERRISDEEVEKRLQALESAADGWDSNAVSRHRFLSDLNIPEVGMIHWTAFHTQNRDVIDSRIPKFRDYRPYQTIQRAGDSESDTEDLSSAGQDDAHTDVEMEDGDLSCLTEASGVIGSPGLSAGRGGNMMDSVTALIRSEDHVKSEPI